MNRHPHNFIDITGQRFGWLTVIECTQRRTHRKPLWRVVCDCGQETEVTANHLRTGNTVSCGCHKRKQLNRRTHGDASRHEKTGAYRSWKAMRNRCRYPSCAGFAYYGGKGITVCERWDSYENFLADMGPRPKGHSIERIDANGNYEPGNCIWLPTKQQRRTRRDSGQLELTSFKL